MPDVKIPMTPRGAQILKDELKRRKEVDRFAIVKAIEEARGHGDLSENADYSAAKEAQSFNEGRIKELEGTLALSEIIDLVGKRALPVLPPWGTGLMTGSLRRLGFRIPDEVINQLRFGRGVDNRLFKATGFRYGYTTRETVLKLGEHQRLAPVMRPGRVGPDPFNELQGEGPLQVGLDMELAAGRESQRLAAALAADGEVGDEHLAGGHEETAAAERVQDGLPAFLIARKAG